MRMGFLWTISEASTCVSIQASSSLQDLSYIINDTFLRGWNHILSSLTKWSHLVASSYVLTSVAPKLRVVWPSHRQLLAYILQRGVLSKHLRIFQTMILAKQYGHERWISSVCHWSQTCLYLRSLQIPLQQLLYSNFKPISTYTTMPWRATNMTPCHPYLRSNHPWGSNGRLWQLLRQIKVGPVASPASWIGTFGNLNYPWDCFSHFELQSHGGLLQKWLFHFQVGWFLGFQWWIFRAVNYMFYASERIWSGITRVHHCNSARYIFVSISYW